MPSPRPRLPIVDEDPYLGPYAGVLADRIAHYRSLRARLERRYGDLEECANAHRYFGIHHDASLGGWWYREWAPAAHALSLIGDFNAWDRMRNQLEPIGDGVWEAFIPDSEGLGHGSRVKVHVVTARGGMDRIPAMIRRAVQDPNTLDFTGQVWSPPDPYRWTSAAPPRPAAPIIYEAHPGMAQERPGVGTYREFADGILPRIRDAGYNCVQLMAVTEHPYYASFGYHVSSFFAPSSRFGTPEELKALVDAAHRLGLTIVMDVVHSHAVKNLHEGLNEFDGSDHQYFLPGAAGMHPQWDSRLFDYGKEEVIRFLLSNLRYWLEEFRFDGFRFDGVTSMLYRHHGAGAAFDHYDRYFDGGANGDAIAYLQLANDLSHEVRPGAITIAEDVSGMPGLCRPVEEGGIGFDYRLGMGIPDYWIELLKHSPDEAWDVSEIWHRVSDRRWKEKTIAYAESHDQALVGDKTLAFWLMDREMYDRMRVDTPSVVIDRGIALHKMLRWFTLAAGGEGYLNFMGNEFGHPEWVDFPREGNRWSYQYARRQWSLADDDRLRYRQLGEWDRAMIRLAREERILESWPARLLNLDSDNHVIVFERNNRVFLFNFHPERSIFDYRFRAPAPGDYRIVLNSDRPEFGGFARIDDRIEYPSFEDAGEPKISVYLPSRCTITLAPTSTVG